MRIILAVAGGLVIASPAAAAKDPPEDKIVCKRQVDADTGSHFSESKRVCRKASEWKELEDGAEQSLRRIRDLGGVRPPPPGMGATPQ